MFCRKCGNEIPDDSVFCLKCGTKVEKVDSKEKIDINQSSDGPIEKTDNPNMEENSSQTEMINEKTEHEMMDKKVIYSVIGIAAIILIMIIAWIIK